MTFSQLLEAVKSAVVSQLDQYGERWEKSEEVVTVNVRVDEELSD